MFGTENLGEQALNKIAELALSSQLEDADNLEVTTSAFPCVLRRPKGYIEVSRRDTASIYPFRDTFG